MHPFKYSIAAIVFLTISCTSQNDKGPSDEGLATFSADSLKKNIAVLA